MGYLRKLLWLPFSRRKVDERVIDGLKDVLEAKLQRGGIPRHLAQNPLFLTRIIEEAYTRAADGEIDGIPCYGRMMDEIENMSATIGVIYHEGKDIDPALYRIMIHYGN